MGKNADLKAPVEDHAVLRLVDAVLHDVAVRSSMSVARPADTCSLAGCGREVGASGRTLTRALLADTGISFARWRTAVRLQADIPLVAAGEPVANASGGLDDSRLR